MNESRQTPPNPRVRLIGLFYLINIITGIYIMAVVNPPWSNYNFLISLFSNACYIAVTLLLFILFKPVNIWLSLVATLFSLAGSAEGLSNMFGKHLTGLYFMIFFGVYCVLLGYLVIRSSFMPRFIGVLLVLGGIGYLTFLSLPFGNSLVPYNYLPGIIGEGMLTFWLLIKGVDNAKWQLLARPKNTKKT